MAIEKTGRWTSRRRRRCRVVRNCVWQFWRGLFAIQRGQFNRKYRESTRSRKHLGEQKSVGPNRAAREGVPATFLTEAFHRIVPGRCTGSLGFVLAASP